MAYASILALQSPEFVSGVRTAGAEPEARRQIIDRIVANPAYASTLPVLDRVFGTHYLPREWPAAVGIEAAMPISLGGQLMAPLRRSD